MQFTTVHRCYYYRIFISSLKNNLILREYIVAQEVGYPTSVESRSDVIRKLVETHIQTKQMYTMIICLTRRTFCSSQFIPVIAAQESECSISISIRYILGPTIGANEVRAHARLRARAHVVATKLAIILLLLFPSTYFSHRRGLPKKLKFGE